MKFLQCACRWVLQHQHKLKQAARSCHLKVKEVLGVDEYRNYEYDNEYTFKVSVYINYVLNILLSS